MMGRLRRLWETIAPWLEPPRKLRLTRSGGWFSAGVLAIGFAAVNTGNNLLYFVLGMMLGAIVVSGILSERDLRDLEVERIVPGDVRARTPATFAYRVSTTRRWMPALALSFRDPPADRVDLVRVDSGSPRRKSYPRTFPRRGVHDLGDVEVSTVFPFGLFRKSRRLEVGGSVRVRPRVPQIDLPEALAGAEEGTAPVLARGEGLDLFGLREHQQGDEARRIHWKATARMARTIVKDTARDEPPAVIIALSCPAGTPEALVEGAVERAAGLAVAFLEGGFAVGLSCGALQLSPAGGTAARESILDALVEAKPEEAAEADLPDTVAVVRVGQDMRAA